MADAETLPVPEPDLETIARTIRAETRNATDHGRIRDTLNILIPAARAILEDHAPGAPAEVRNAALVRLVGWLYHNVPGPYVPDVHMTESGRDVPEVKLPRLGHALSRSGAASLLSQWRSPGLGPVG